MTAAFRRFWTRLPELWASARWRVRDRSRHYRARLHRKRLTGVTFIGITGSAGKTTTKELAAAMLASQARCQRNEASGNDHELVDRTVLATGRQHRYSIVEMSASEPGYLDRPLRVVRPQIGVLTLIAREHYGAYRNLGAVAAEKGKLIDALPADGVAVLNRDDPAVRAIGERHAGRVVWVGRDEGADLRLLDANSPWPGSLTLLVRYEGTEYPVRTRLHGTQLALPVLCALGVALAAGMTLAQAIGVLERIDPVQGRMQIEVGADGVTFVRDDFKAPQWSLGGPLQFLRDAVAARKVVVFGSISDTPNDPAQRYTRAAREALEIADLVVLVGSRTLSPSRAQRIRDDGSLRSFVTVEEAADFLRQELRSGDLVLLKGTNRRDHLVRLVLDRSRPVRCWQTSCGRDQFCGRCPMLYRVPSGSTMAGDSRLGNQS